MASAKFLADEIEISPRTDSRIGLIAINGIGRAHNLAELPARQGCVETRKTGGVCLKKSASDGAAFPNAHEPHKIETQTRDIVPFAVGNIAKANFAVELGGEFLEPCPSVDLIKMRMWPVGEGRGFARCGHLRREAMTRYAVLSIVQFLVKEAAQLDHSPVKALY